MLCRCCCIEPACSGLHLGTMSAKQHGVNTRPDCLTVRYHKKRRQRVKPLCGNTSIYSLVVVWLLVHDFGLNRWWLWDFQLGPAPGCWGRSSSRDGGGGYPSSISAPLTIVEGVTHQRRQVLAEGLVHHQVGTRSQTHTARGCTQYMSCIFQLGRAGLPAVNHQL